MSIHNKNYGLGRSEILQLSVTDAEQVIIDRALTVLQIASAGVETRVLQRPENVGLRLTLVMSVDGGDVAVTQEGSGTFNQAGNTTITLNDVGDLVDLVSIVSAAGDYKWRIVANDGAALS